MAFVSSNIPPSLTYLILFIPKKKLKIESLNYLKLCKENKKFPVNFN